ncbi:hypothetical protein PSP6_210193 [Paraburkholderia tropica]|nr:hypothetical protein PSP6_210193 [Paraburkholderia tropica]
MRGAACAACKRELGPLPGDLLSDGLERLNAAARERGGEVSLRLVHGDGSRVSVRVRRRAHL